MTIPFAEVIGDPIAHSRSPDIHGFWLDRLEIVGDYRAHHITSDDLADYIVQRRDDDAWRGCSVTLPHKIALLDLVPDPGDVRGSIGAMNTVARDADGGIFGTNTDAGGFFAPLADVALDGAHIGVVGTGGAAHAVMFALKQAGVGRVTLLARSPLKGAALLARFGLRGDVARLGIGAPPVDLLINATSLGMVGHDPLDLELSALPEHAIVYDIVYTPLETPLLAAARQRGLATVDGHDMLLGQAAVAFELFFGQAPPDADDEVRALLTQSKLA